MKILALLILCCLPSLASAIQVLPPAGGFRNQVDRDNFMFYQNYNHMNEQQRLMRQQVQIQRDMLRLQQERNIYGR